MVNLRGISYGREHLPNRLTSCSISPQGLALVFVLLGATSIGIGVGFAAVGAWLVLPFAGLEVLALAVAFFALARRAPGGALSNKKI
jgi:uncharacterized membrane protein